MKIDKIAILGAGSWGTALAWLGKKGNEFAFGETTRIGSSVAERVKTTITFQDCSCLIRSMSRTSCATA